jgi:beta-lactamase regulating signal transducer with metallopeptidase domain
MTALDFQTFAETAAGRGLNTVLEGLLLASFSWAGLRLFAARSSMTKFAVWFSTLLVIAALPWLTTNSSAGISSGSHIPELILSSAWASVAFFAWVAISSVLLLRLGFSLCHVWRLRHACQPLDISSFSALAEIGERSPGSRRVSFLVSDKIAVPTALGFFHPAVVLPSWTLRELPADELKVIVLHELAHLHRWDDWTNLVQKIVKAFFFFHPAVWWIDSRLALEREIACDDRVLEQTANSKTYAASLVLVAEKVLAEKLRMGRAFAMAQTALGRVREVSFRVAQILDNRPRSNRTFRPALAIIGGVAVITAAAMPYAPNVISFRQKAQPVYSADKSTFGIRPAAVIPAQWTNDRLPTAAINRTHRFVKRARPRKAATDVESAALSQGSRSAPRSMAIPVKATFKRNRGAKVFMTRAPLHTRPAETLLLLRATQLDESGALWTYSVWRVTAANGEQQTIQEIVMTSI